MGEIKVTFDADARTRLRKITTAINDLTRAVKGLGDDSEEATGSVKRLTEPAEEGVLDVCGEEGCIIEG